MAPDSTAATSCLVILNPKSGTSSADGVRRALARPIEEGAYRIHEVAEGDDIPAIVRAALDRGADRVVAAGGDGTVSTVADVLAGTPATLAILPMGTTNVLSRELGIPVEGPGTGEVPAAALLDGPHRVARIDAMKVDGRHYFTQVGVGIDALMIRDTDDQAKKRFGRVAYLWTAARRLIGFQSRRFDLTVDNRTERVRATQIVVANVGMLGQPPYRWGPGIRPDDGKLSVCVVRARSIWHFLRLFWYVARGRHGQSPHVRYFEARRMVKIEGRRPTPVQADGEFLGETPVAIDLIPAALRVLAPVDDPLLAEAPTPSPGR